MNDKVKFGDLPGHEFHGNQWTAGLGAADMANEASLRANRQSTRPEISKLAHEMTQAAMGTYGAKPKAEAHAAAASAHREAASALREARLDPSGRPNAAADSHDAAANFHERAAAAFKEAAKTKVQPDPRPGSHGGRFARDDERAEFSNEIKRAHIFKTGEHPGANAKGLKFDETTLDGIVSAFDSLAQAGRVPLKFGHVEPKPGAPALGWVSRIWREGKDLFGDFVDMPTVVFDAVKKGLYKFVSIELLKNAERDGKSYPFVLDSVALLGADPPAVDGIGDLQKLLHSRDLFKFERAVGFTRDISLSTGDDDTMDEATLNAAIAKALGPMQEKLTSLTADVSKAQGDAAKFAAERDALKAQLEAQTNAQNAEKVKLTREAVTLVIEGSVRAKKITPAQREVMVAHFHLTDDKAMLAIDVKEVEALCGISSAEAKKVMDGKSAFSRAPGKTDEGGPGGTELQTASESATLVFKRTKERGIDPFAAMTEEARTNPAFAQALLANFTGREA